MPSIDAAAATLDSLKVVARGLEVGPILLGLGDRAHIVTPSVTARGLFNTAALASAGAGDLADDV